MEGKKEGRKGGREEGRRGEREEGRENGRKEGRERERMEERRGRGKDGRERGRTDGRMEGRMEGREGWPGWRNSGGKTHKNAACTFKINPTPNPYILHAEPPLLRPCNHFVPCHSVVFHPRLCLPPAKQQIVFLLKFTTNKSVVW